MTIVIIVGCMRNGTSLVTQILNKAGMYVGEHSDLDWRGTRDPEGIYENLDFVRLNNRVLNVIGSDWIQVDKISKATYLDWTLFFESIPARLLLQQAQDLLTGLREKSPNSLYGWKDPRNSLTLPFWFRLTYDEPVKVIWCIRHPFHSASSMVSLNYGEEELTLSKAWAVWHLYNQSIVNTFSTYYYDVHIVKFENWFNSNQEKTLNELMAFIEIDNYDSSLLNGLIRPDLNRYNKYEPLNLMHTSSLYHEISNYDIMKTLDNNKENT